MSKTENSDIESINAPEVMYSANSIMAWLCIDAPGYRKLREYVVRNLEFNINNNETLVRKIITSKQFKLKNNGIHNQIKEYLDSLPDYETWFTLVWVNNPKITHEIDGIETYPLNQEAEDLFNLIKVYYENYN